MGLVLQDLTFVHIGNSDYVKDKVNFAKRWQQYNILVRRSGSTLPVRLTLFEHPLPFSGQRASIQARPVSVPKARGRAPLLRQFRRRAERERSLGVVGEDPTSTKGLSGKTRQ